MKHQHFLGEHIHVQNTPPSMSYTLLQSTINNQMGAGGRLEQRWPFTVWERLWSLMTSVESVELTAGFWGQSFGNAVAVKHSWPLETFKGDPPRRKPTPRTLLGLPQIACLGSYSASENLISWSNLCLLAGVLHSSILKLRFWLPSFICHRPQLAVRGGIQGIGRDKSQEFQWQSTQPHNCRSSKSHASFK